MKSQSLNVEYLLFFRDTQWARRLSPEDMQTATMEWSAWFEKLRQQGKVKDGRPLEQEGAVISRTSGGAVINTPLVGSKETVSSYSLLQVGHLTEAVEIAEACPVLNYGATIEVRQVAGHE